MSLKKQIIPANNGWFVDIMTPEISKANLLKT
jgi:hypothetical protein